MSEYTEQATIFDLDRNEFIWNPDFSAKMDDKGKWTGSESFTCRLKDVTKILPTMGAACTLEGWEFLTANGIGVENIEGDLAQVTISFSGYQESNFTFDDNNLNNYVYDLQIQTSEAPLVTHHKTLPSFGSVTANERNILAKLITGEWKGDEEPTNKIAYSTSDSTKSFTFTTVDGITFYDYIVNKGRESFYLPSQIWRITYTTKSRPTASKLNEVGKIKEPKGAPDMGANRNWLFNGMNINEKDRIYTVTEEYILSDVGGWDTYLYDTA